MDRKTIQKALDASKSLKECADKLNIGKNSRSNKKLKRMIAKYSCDTSGLEKRRSKFLASRFPRIPMSKILIENSSYRTDQFLNTG